MAHDIAKQSVWSLYARSQLLFSSCLAMRYDSSINDMDKADFAVQAWVETEAIEAALNTHTCGIEKATSECASEILLLSA